MCGSLERRLPLLKTFVWVSPRHVVDEHAAVSPAVERHAQRLEALLSGGVPQLEGHLCFSVGQGRAFFHEVRSDGRLLRLADLFVAVAVEEGGLADARLSNKDHLEVGPRRLRTSYWHRRRCVKWVDECVYARNQVKFWCTFQLARTEGKILVF